MKKKIKKLETTLVKLGVVNAKLKADYENLLRFHDEVKARMRLEIYEQHTTIRVLSQMLNSEVSDEK